MKGTDARWLASGHRWGVILAGGDGTRLSHLREGSQATTGRSNSVPLWAAKRFWVRLNPGSGNW